MTTTQETSLRSDFRERAKANDVPVARLIGFKAEKIGDGRATVSLAAGPLKRVHLNRKPSPSPQKRACNLGETEQS